MKITDVEMKKVDNDVIVAEKSNYVIVPEDIYVGEYIESEMQSKDGDYFYIHRWAISYKDKSEMKETIISETSSTKLTANTKLGKILTTLGADIEEGNEYKLSNYYGKKCKLIVKQTIKNGEKRNTITEHLKL